jgi:hypothetical protein
MVVALVLVAAGADAEPLPTGGRQATPFRLQSDGNELVVAPQAPVAYTALEELTGAIGVPLATPAAPIRVVRAAPPQTIDYVLCVTKDGTLVVGERVHTLDDSQGRYVFTRGGIARSYPPLDEAGAWRWFIEVPLSREVTVTLELRARASWPVEAVTVTPPRRP